MKRRIAVISSVVLGLLLGVATLAVFWSGNGVSKITVSFVNAEASYGPPFSNDECERLAFAVRNDGKIAVPFVVSDIRDEHGNWLPPFISLTTRMRVELRIFIFMSQTSPIHRLCGCADIRRRLPLRRLSSHLDC